MCKGNSKFMWENTADVYFDVIRFQKSEIVGGYQKVFFVKYLKIKDSYSLVFPYKREYSKLITVFLNISW